MEFLGVFDNVGNMDKPVLAFVNVNEGRLDIVEDIFDFAFIDITS